MKRVVVLLLGIVIGILAGLFFLQSLAARANPKFTNPFRRVKVVELKESGSPTPASANSTWSNILLADFAH